MSLKKISMFMVVI